MVLKGIVRVSLGLGTRSPRLGLPQEAGVDDPGPARGDEDVLRARVSASQSQKMFFETHAVQRLPGPGAVKQEVPSLAQDQDAARQDTTIEELGGIELGPDHPSFFARPRVHERERPSVEDDHLRGFVRRHPDDLELVLELELGRVLVEGSRFHPHQESLLAQRRRPVTAPDPGHRRVEAQRLDLLAREVLLLGEALLFQVPERQPARLQNPQLAAPALDLDRAVGGVQVSLHVFVLQVYHFDPVVVVHEQVFFVGRERCQGLRVRVVVAGVEPVHKVCRLGRFRF